MSMLRKSILLALGVGITTTTASAEPLDNMATVFSQGEQPLLVAEAFGSRRRGDCEGNPSGDDVWTLNLCEMGPFCYESADKVSLWVPKDKRSGRTDRLEITKMGDEGIEERWDADEDTFTWPTDYLGIESGMSYVIKLSKGSRNYYAGEIVLHQIPANTTNAEKADWMEGKGCRSQASMLNGQST